MSNLINDLHEIAEELSADEYSECAELIRDAIEEIERLRGVCARSLNIDTALSAAEARGRAAGLQKAAKLCDQSLYAWAAANKIRHALANTPPEPPKAETAWRPMDSAPKDETDVLLAGTFNGWSRPPLVAGWYEKHTDHPGWYSYDDVNDLADIEPTHWQPLPTPPEPPALDVADRTEGE